MIVLAITTSTERGGLALFDKKNQKLLSKKAWTKRAQSNQDCVFVLHQMLKSLRSDVSFISDILLDVGPGSFTGTRIGVSMAKTLAYSVNIPVHTLTSLQILANQCTSIKSQKAVLNKLIVIDAHKSLFYFWNEATLKIELQSGENLLKKLEVGKMNRFMGIIPAKFEQAALKLNTKDLKVQISKKMTENYPLPQTMGQIFFQSPSRFETRSWREVEPLYIRDPDAIEKMKEN